MIQMSSDFTENTHKDVEMVADAEGSKKMWEMSAKN